MGGVLVVCWLNKAVLIESDMSITTLNMIVLNTTALNITALHTTLNVPISVC